MDSLRSSRRYAEPDALFPSIKNREDIRDFIIRLDLLAGLACVKKTRIDLFMRTMWPRFIPNVRYTSDVEDDCWNYFDEYRLGLKILSSGSSVQKRSILMRSLVPVAILLKLSQAETETIDRVQLENDLISELREIEREEQLIRSRVKENCYWYFDRSYRLSPQTAALLRQNQDSLLSLYDTMYRVLNRGKGPAVSPVKRTAVPAGSTEASAGRTPVPAGSTEAPAEKAAVPAGSAETSGMNTTVPTGGAEASAEKAVVPTGSSPVSSGISSASARGSEAVGQTPTASVKVPGAAGQASSASARASESSAVNPASSRPDRERAGNKPLLFMKVMCLLYAALTDQDRGTAAREELLKKHWKKIFKDVPFSQIALGRADAMIAADQDLKAVDMLFKYPLKEIRSGRLVRRVVVCLCVHQVIARLPHNSSKDLVIDEALSLFARFATLSVGKEEEDIETYLKKFITPAGTVDERISELLWENSEAVSSLLKASMEDVTATDGARKRSWWEEILSKKDQEMNQLQNQIDMTKITTVYNMVELLCGSSYNFVLSRLYRCAYDYDSLSSGEIKALLKTLIQVLRLFGVQTSGEDLIGTKIPAGSEEAKGTVSEIVPDMEEDCVVFPGWNVAGDAAVLPVVCRRSEEEKR